MTGTRESSRSALLACVSTLALMLAATAPALAQSVNNGDTRTDPIDMEEDTAVDINNGGTLSVSCDVSDGEDDPSDPDYTEAILFDVPEGDVTIDNGGTAEMSRGEGCNSDASDLSTIRVTDSGDEEAPSSGTIDVNGTLNAPEGGRAITVEDGAGGQTIDDNDTEDDETDDEVVEHQVDIAVGDTGVVNGDVYLGSGGNHTFTNEGEVNGTVTMVGRDTVDYVNDGTHTADEGDPAIEVLESAENLDRISTINNTGTITGDINLNGRGEHIVQSTGTVTGDINVDQQSDEGFTEATIANFGVFNGDINVANGTGGLEVLTNDNGTPDDPDDDFETEDDHFVAVQNGGTGEFTGNVNFGNGGNHTFANSGTMEGRVTAGDGDNTVTIAGGTMNVTDADDFTMGAPVISTGGGDDTFIMTDGALAPVLDPEDDTPLEGTLVDMGDGDDRVELAFGTISGATTAFDLGDGDDTFAFVASSAEEDFSLSGSVLGGIGDDTFETSGRNADTPFMVTGSIDLQDFESFNAAANSTIIDLDDDIVTAGDLTAFDVWGGTLTVSEDAFLTIVTGFNGTDEQIAFADGLGLNGTATRLFDSQMSDISGTLTLEQPSFLTGDGGTFTVSDGGTNLFRVQSVDGTVINGAVLIDDIIDDGIADNDPTISDGSPRAILENGSSLGLSMDSKDVMGRLENGDAVETGTFTVMVASDFVSREVVINDNGTPDDADDDFETFNDTVIDSTDDIDTTLINLVDENPYYKFAYNFVMGADGFDRLQIIATRTPGFAQTILDNSFGNALGSVGSILDGEYEACSDADLASDGTFCNSLRRLGLRPDSEIINGLDEAAPNRMSGGYQSIMSTMNQANDLIANRTNLVRAGTVGPRTVRYSSAAPQEGPIGMNAGSSVWAGNHAWVQGFGGSVDQDAVGNNPGYDATLYGGLLGLDRRLNRTWLVGLYGGYASTDVDGKDASRDQVDVTSYLGGVYGSWFDTSSSAEVVISGGYDKYEGSRIGFLGGVANRDYSGFHAGFRGSADTNVTLFDRLLLTPGASLQYTYLSEEAYDETGAATAILSVDERTSHSFQSRLGAKLQAPGRVGDNFLLPYFSLAWTHEFLDSTSETRAAFAAGTTGAKFTTPEIDVPADALNAGLGLDFTTLRGTTISVGYDFTIQEEATAHLGAATVRIAF